MDANCPAPKCYFAPVSQPVCFVSKRARAPKTVILGKGNPMRKLVNFHLKGTEAIAREHGGNRLVAYVKYQALVILTINILFSMNLPPWMN